MDDWKAHFGTFTDYTYDLTADEELPPIQSPLPETVLNLPNIIFEYNEEQKRIRLKTEKLEKITVEHQKKNKFKGPTKLSTMKPPPRTIDELEDSDESQSSSSSADFEIEVLQKRKKDKKVPKVKMHSIVYSFSKPEPEVRRMFVTSRAPRSKNTEKSSIKRDFVHLSTKLSSRRKIPGSSMAHQHELMFSNFSDFEKK